MLVNFELLSLLLPDEIKSKLMLLDTDLTPEEQFNGLVEIVNEETGLELKFNKNKSLRENLEPVLSQIPIKDRIGCNKMLKFVETKINENKHKINDEKSILIGEESETDDKGHKSSKKLDTSVNPDFLYFK